MVETSRLVDGLLPELMETGDDYINQVMKDAITGGKRLRPTIASMFVQCLGGDRNDCLRIASGIEMLHSASLLFDDIIDKDETRRGEPSAFKKHGVENVLLAAPSMVSSAFSIGIRESDEILRLIVDSYNKVADGNVLDRDYGLDYQKYMQVIDLKTVPLFQGPAKLAVIISFRRHGFQSLFFPDSNKDRFIYMADQYGQMAGELFQMADDLVDVVKSLKERKPIGDLIPKNHKPTLAFILLNNKTKSDSVRNILDAYIQGHELTQIEFSALTKAMYQNKIVQTIAKTLKKGCSDIQNITKELPDNDFKIMINNLPEYLCERLLSEADTTLDTLCLLQKSLGVKK